MRRSLTLYVLALLVAASAVGSAGSASNPEVSDARGDVDAQHVIDAATAEDLLPLDEAPDMPDPDVPVEPPAAAEMDQAGDILAAWVSSESRDAFTVTLQLAEVPDHENASTALVDLWLHFDVEGQDYRALSSLQFPPEEGRIDARFDLFKGDATTGDEIAGSVDNETDTVTFFFEKSKVGSPEFGDRLTEFYATSNVPKTGLVLDYAPDARKPGLGDLDVANPDASPVPTYGAAYEFGQFQGAVPSALTVSVLPQSLTVQAGEQGTAAVSIKNSAPLDDTVTITVVDAPNGWQTPLSTSAVTLTQGEAQLVDLFVVTPSGASGQGLVKVRVTSSLGGDETTALSVAVTPPPPPPSNGDRAGGDGGGSTGASGGGGGDAPATGQQPVQAQPPATTTGDDDGSSEEENGAPFLSPLALLGAGAAAARYAKRGRKDRKDRKDRKE